MQATPSLSLILPAYQEENRIGDTMLSICQYLDEHHPGTELIVVCDGCTDKTAAVARSSANNSKCKLSVIELPTNQGKGAAVKAGMLAASGEYLFFTDADLSYAPYVIEDFLKELQDGADVAIAQRKKTTEYPGLGRKILARVSRFIVGNFVIPGIRDTQAGFKGFRREAAVTLFNAQRTSRFLFDLEILCIASDQNLKISKVYVDWQDRPGSTVRIFLDSIRSARDLALIWYWHKTGAYNRAIASKKTS